MVLTQIGLLLAGLILILLGANWLVDGSSSIARKFGISEFIIGLTIVGIGTSAPEMVVSFISSFNHNSDMAIGNVVGSNIFNTMLILGVTAMISPLTITRTNARRDIPMNILATVLLIILGLKSTIFGVGSDSLSRFDGLFFVILFGYYLYSSVRKDNADSSEEDNTKVYKTFTSIVMIAGGLAGLVFGGRMFVNSAVEIARIAGLSEKFVAITILAGGTSLPELATCVVAAVKGKGQLALGNILGSNISNILLILGGAALINPLNFGGMSSIDLIALFFCSLFILLSVFMFRQNKLDRIEGGILVSMEAMYMTYLLMNL